MKYNWQQSNWGKFNYSLKEFEDILYVFTEKSEHLKDLLHAIPKALHEENLIEILVYKALKTYKI